MVTLTRRPGQQGGHNINTERNDRLVELWNAGLTAAELAERFGVSKARVYQVLRLYAKRLDAAEEV